MKKSILIYAIIVSLAFSACGHNTANQEFKYETAESSDRVLTKAELSQTAEEALAKRLQATIEKFDNVNEAIITIDNTNETETTVEVFIATELNKPLTDEQKTGITNLIKDCFSEELAVTVDLRTE